MSTFRRNRISQRYHKHTQGLNAQGFFSPTAPILYSTFATIADFAKADPAGIAGTIGLYAKDGTLIAGVIPNGDFYQVVQKNSDGTLKKGSLIESEAGQQRKVLYLAPFIQQHAIGWDGTAGSLNLSIVGGLQEFVLIVKDNSSANQPFPTMEGRSIVRGGTPTDYNIAADIVRSGGNSFDYERDADVPFALWEVITDIIGAIPPTTAAPFTKIGGSNQITTLGDATPDAVPGRYFIDMSSANPTKNIIAKIKSSAFDGTSTVIELDYKNAVLQSNSGAPAVRTILLADVTYEDAAVVDASNVFGITITGVGFGTHMDVVVSEDLGDATVTKGDWRLGQGSAQMLADQEDESIVFDGFTTGNEAWVGDFGAPDLFVDENSQDQYTTYYIESLGRIIPSAGTPQNQTLHKKTTIIGAISGTDLETQLNVIFNLP